MYTNILTLSILLISAPLLINRAAISIHPRKAAECNGVQPFCILHKNIIINNNLVMIRLVLIMIYHIVIDIIVSLHYPCY